VTAATGLALATAPDVAHYLPFLAPLLDNNGLGTGLATILAPAIAASLFVYLAILTVHCESPLIICLDSI
jgi:calcium permeable stress-gated cation channel